MGGRRYQHGGTGFQPPLTDQQVNRDFQARVHIHDESYVPNPANLQNAGCNANLMGRIKRWHIVTMPREMHIKYPHLQPVIEVYHRLRGFANLIYNDIDIPEFASQGVYFALGRFQERILTRPDEPFSTKAWVYRTMMEAVADDLALSDQLRELYLGRLLSGEGVIDGQLGTLRVARGSEPDLVPVWVPVGQQYVQGYAQQVRAADYGRERRSFVDVGTHGYYGQQVGAMQYGGQQVGAMHHDGQLHGSMDMGGHSYHPGDLGGQRGRSMDLGGQQYGSNNVPVQRSCPVNLGAQQYGSRGLWAQQHGSGGAAVQQYGSGGDEAQRRGSVDSGAVHHQRRVLGELPVDIRTAAHRPGFLAHSGPLDMGTAPGGPNPAPAVEPPRNTTPAPAVAPGGKGLTHVIDLITDEPVPEDPKTGKPAPLDPKAGKPVPPDPKTPAPSKRVVKKAPVPAQVQGGGNSARTQATQPQGAVTLGEAQATQRPATACRNSAPPRLVYPEPQPLLLSTVQHLEQETEKAKEKENDGKTDCETDNDKTPPKPSFVNPMHKPPKLEGPWGDPFWNVRLLHREEVRERERQEAEAKWEREQDIRRAKKRQRQRERQEKKAQEKKDQEKKDQEMKEQEKQSQDKNGQANKKRDASNLSPKARVPKRIKNAEEFENKDVIPERGTGAYYGWMSQTVGRLYPPY